MSDYFGSSRMIVALSTLTSLGHLLFAWGVSARTYWLMVVGRTLFGMGGESLEVAQSRMTTEWFRDGLLGLALGLNLTSARLATALNDILSPWLSRQIGPTGATFTGLGFCILSFACGLLLIYVTFRYPCRGCEMRVSISRNTFDTEERDTGSLRGSVDTEESGLFDSPVEVEERSPFLANWESKVELESSPTKVRDPVFLDQQQEQEEESSETVHWRDIQRLSLPYWLLCLSTFLLYGAVNPFFHVVSGKPPDEFMIL